MIRKKKEVNKVQRTSSILMYIARGLLVDGRQQENSTRPRIGRHKGIKSWGARLSPRSK